MARGRKPKGWADVEPKAREEPDIGEETEPETEPKPKAVEFDADLVLLTELFIKNKTGLIQERLRFIDPAGASVLEYMCSPQTPRWVERMKALKDRGTAFLFAINRPGEFKVWESDFLNESGIRGRSTVFKIGREPTPVPAKYAAMLIIQNKGEVGEAARPILT